MVDAIIYTDQFFTIQITYMQLCYNGFYKSVVITGFIRVGEINQATHFVGV
jgi:hypothetical protein